MAQHADPPAQAAATVVVPMAVQALVISDDIVRTPAQFAPLIEPDYARLLQRPEAGAPTHDLMDDIDVSYWRIQARSNPRFIDMGTGNSAPGRTGIYLSWCLPKLYRAALTASETATENKAEWNSRKMRQGFKLTTADKEEGHASNERRSTLQFRPAPDRWVIMRSVREDSRYAKQFLVESNCIRKLDDPGIIGKVELQTSPGMDPEQPLADQAMLRLGRVVHLYSNHVSGGHGVGTQSRYRQPFHAAEMGHEFFPDYAPHNMGVFSFFDDLADVAESDDPYTVDYLVLGYHSEVRSSDPFCFVDSDRLLPVDKNQNSTAAMLNRDLLSTFKFTADMKDPLVAKFLSAAADSTGRTLSYGTKHGMLWNRKQTLGYTKWPAISLQESICDSHPISIGTDVMDALAAHVHMTAETEGVNQAHDMLTQLLVRHTAQSTNVDALARAADDNTCQSFLIQSKDVVWKLPKGAKEDVESQPGSAPGTSTLEGRAAAADLVTRRQLLVALNEGQAALDACDREQQQLLRQLYGCWWNANSIKHSPSSRRSRELESRNQAKAQEIQSRLGELAKFRGNTDGGTLSAVMGLKTQIEADLGVGHSLVKASAAPFGSHQDPVVLIAGMKSAWPADFAQETSPVRIAEQVVVEKAQPTEEKVLQSMLPDISDPAIRLVREFYNLQESYAAASQAQDVYGARSEPQQVQEWFPLFLEWKIEYYHIPFHLWELVPDPVTGSWHYTIPSEKFNLKSNPRVGQDVRTVGGRISCLPQAGAALRSIVKQLFTPAASSASSSNKEDLASLLERAGNLEYFSSPLAGLADHLVTQCRGHYPYPDCNDSEMQLAMGISDETMRLLDGSPTQQEVAPYGLSTTLPPSYTNAFSPFKPVMHGQARFVKFAIVDKFGQIVSGLRLTPEGHGAMYPNVAPSLACGLLPSETLATEQVPPEQEPYWPNTVVNPEEQSGHCQFFQLPPRINQAARLNTFFLQPLSNAEVASSLADQSQKIIRQIASEWDNPVWAWLLPNFQSHSIQVYSPSGDFLVEVLLDHTRWQTYDSRGPMESTGNTSESEGRLPSLIQALQGYEFAKHMFDMLASGSESITLSSAADFDASLPAALGRPFCVADIGVSIELSAPPLENASLYSNRAPEMYLTDYNFQIAVGNPLAAFDGLIGTFPSQGNINRIASAFTRDAEPLNPSISGTATVIEEDKSLHPQPIQNVRPYFIPATTPDLALKHREHLRTISVVMDPKIPVRVYSGSLFPVANLSLPSWPIDAALRAMKAFFPLGPILVPRKPDQVKDVPSSVKTDAQSAGPSIQMPLGGGGGSGAWKWLQPGRTADGIQTTWDSIPIRPLDGVLKVEASAQSELVEGYVLVG